MTLTEKKNLINQITSLLDRLIDVDAENPSAPAEPPIDKPMEMLILFLYQLIDDILKIWYNIFGR